MRLYLFFFLFIGALAPVTTARAQSAATEKTYTGGLVFHMGMTQRGGGFGMDFISEKQNRQWVIGGDFFYLKDAREGPTSSFFGKEQGRNYVFGKLNHFFVLTPHIGVQQSLLGAPGSKFLDVLGGVSIGPALGIYSPYYLEIFEPLAGNPLFGSKVVRPYNPQIHGYTRIVGRASLFDTRWNFGIQPGLSLRAHAHFDLDHSLGGVSGIRLGFHADWFFQSPEIFASEVLQIENRRFFPSVTLGFLFGNRW